MHRLGGLLLAALALAAAFALLVSAGCGESALARAYAPYASELENRLGAETKVWDELAARAGDQIDARGVGRYRSFLETKAAPFYAEFEKGLRGVVPGHDKLARVHEEVVGYAGDRRRFVDAEIRRLSEAARPEYLSQLEEAERRADDAYAEYLQLVGEEAPDPRLANLVSDKKAFLDGKLQRAVEGAAEVEDVRAALERDLLPRLRKLRQDRFDDTAHGRAFRGLVAATEEYFELLGRDLPAVVASLRTTRAIEGILQDADRRRAAVRRLLDEARRAR